MDNLEGRLKLHSGSTLINLACSGNPDWAMVSGGYYWMVGDSSSGKTVLTVGCLAEASINPAFDEYDLVFDNAEDGAMMNIEKFYGSRLAGRIQPPRMVDGMPVYSRTDSDFYFNLEDRIRAVKKKKGRPFIYLLDSMDSLDTYYAEDKFQDRKKEAEGGPKAAGDYGDGKAKTNSTHLRRVVADLRDTGSILIILSQTRDNINATMFQKKTTYAGGRALKFYAQWQLWSSIAGDINRTVNGNRRQVGITAKISIEKNRLSGKEWTVRIPIYWSHGIDDVGSCIEYLVTEKRFKESDGKLTAPDFDFSGKREVLIDQIEAESLEAQLRCIVTETWKTVERKCSVDRKSRYH